MKFFVVASLFAVTGSLSPVVVEGSSPSFVRDVVRKGGAPPPPGAGADTPPAALNDALLAKAVPLDEYRARLKAQGLRLQDDAAAILDQRNVGDTSSRRLDQSAYYYYYNGGDDAVANDDQDEGEQQQEEGDGAAQNEDDYYVAEENYASFNGFALKYAKCQPVQRFSENAVNSGEYSPMVVDDIVILRLCPSFYCSSTRNFGCFYDFADYAIHLTDYIRIMLRYKMDREGQLCEYCQSCRRRQRRAEDNYNYYNVDDYNNNNGDDNAGDYGYSSSCNGYGTYCVDEDGNSVCDGYNNGDAAAGDDANAGDDDSYTLDAEGYLQIIDCVQVEGGYFVRPRCDGYSETLSMGIFHDKFCSQYAGDTVNITAFNLGIDQSYFEEFAGDAGCMDCSEMDYPPYFNANSNLCNRIDITGARCTSSLDSNLFGNNTDDDAYSYSSESTQCSFIESLRFGTYDENGQLYSSESMGFSRQVTKSQKYLLGVSLSICALLAMYACYLHHSITNLLIKSLTHTDLLPPTRHRRRSGSANRKRSKRGSRKPVADDDEDEDDNEFQMQDGAVEA